MVPFGASYAVSKGLVGFSPIWNKRVVIYISLKGDDKILYWYLGI